MKSTPVVNASNTSWQKLYTIGGASALILLVYCLATLVIMALTGGQPATVEETFQMLQANRFVGLLQLDLLTVFCMPLYYLLFLSLWVSLRQVDQVSVTVATVLIFAGVTLFLAMPSVFSYLSLSDRYAAATSEVQRVQILAAGEAVLATDIWHGTGAMVGGLMVQSGAVLISVLMLRSAGFRKVTGYVGIVTHGLDLAHIVVGFFAPGLGVALMAVAGVLYLAWFPLVAQNLFQLGRSSNEATAQPALRAVPES